MERSSGIFVTYKAYLGTMGAFRSAERVAFRRQSSSGCEEIYTYSSEKLKRASVRKLIAQSGLSSCGAHEFSIYFTFAKYSGLRIFCGNSSLERQTGGVSIGRELATRTEECRMHWW